MLRATCSLLPRAHIQATITSVAWRAQSSSSFSPPSPPSRSRDFDLMDRFSDREVELRRKGTLFRNRARARRNIERVSVEIDPPDVLKTLKVRVKFAEKMLAHLLQTEVKINAQLARPLDTDSGPLEAKAVKYLGRKRREDMQ
ncbi:uncharacterized protein LOC135824337 [Sycon ciliatum]|uniref:uncharacterized protein LOC135824337 n=1 Tax=Sycon ciliatum TaxID=27933 RepID=UPI0031F6F277